MDKDTPAKMPPVVVEFKQRQCAIEAWNAIKNCLDKLNPPIATTGVMMEAMGDLAEAIDKFDKENGATILEMKPSTLKLIQ